MNVLALDFGLRRIGYAHGSTLSQVAFAGGVLFNDRQLFSEIRALIKRYQTDLIIVGKPVRADQTEGDISAEIESFVDELLLLGPEVVTYNERYTTQIAQAKLHELQLKKSDRQKPIDDLAAQVLLQLWFDQHSSTSS